MTKVLFDRRAIYAKLEGVGVPVPKHVVLEPGSAVVDEQEDYIEVDMSETCPRHVRDMSIGGLHRGGRRQAAEANRREANLRREGSD